MKIEYNLVSNSLSTFKTTHCFQCCIEVCTAEDMVEAIRFCKTNNSNYIILGNGSNVFFTKKTIKTVVIKNLLRKRFSKNSPNSFTVSSSTSIQSVLKYCFTHSLDSFYYLSAVPATIGGAIAMNAGRGRHFNKTILDYVSYVKVIDPEGNVLQLESHEIKLGYRKTIFTGINNYFILEVTFAFPTASLVGNPILERIGWAKVHQDFSGGNCGSVFKECDAEILETFKGFKLSETLFSTRAHNWIVNKSQSPTYIKRLISAVQLAHKREHKRIELELIEVS